MNLLQALLLIILYLTHFAHLLYLLGPEASDFSTSVLMTSLPQWLLTSLHFHLLLLWVLLIVPCHLSLICSLLFIHLPSSPAFLPCLQWRHLLGHSALLFYIHLPNPSWGSFVNIIVKFWRGSLLFRVSSQGRNNSNGGRGCGWMYALGLRRPWVQTLIPLPTICETLGMLHFFHLWNEDKTDPKVGPDYF